MNRTRQFYLSTSIVVAAGMVMSFSGCPRPPQPPQTDIVAQNVSQPLTDPADARWATITPYTALTSGNPSKGGHGPVGTNPDNDKGQLLTSVTPEIEIRAAHDGDMLYMRFGYLDPTQDDSGRQWSYSLGAWSSGGNEDRLYVAWPIVDVAGRENSTFSEVGCAMLCHQRAYNDRNMILPNTVDANENCAVCHALAPGNTFGRTPLFEHFIVPGNDCSVCHSADYAVTELQDLFDGGDMIAPASGAFDLWHWKAQRSNPLGVAEDQYTANGRRRTRDDSNLAPDNTRGDGSGPAYIWTDGTTGDTPLMRSLVDATSNRLAEWNDTTMQYENLETSAVFNPVEGQGVSRHVLRDDLVAAGNASATIGAQSMYDGAGWAVVLARPLQSPDPARETPSGSGMFFDTDIDFNTSANAVIKFSVATTDNSGAGHHGIAGPISMRFQ